MKLMRIFSKHPRQPRTQRRCRPQLEVLPRRDLPSATVELVGGVITIEGTAANESVRVWIDDRGTLFDIYDDQAVVTVDDRDAGRYGSTEVVKRFDLVRPIYTWGPLGPRVTGFTRLVTKVCFFGWEGDDYFLNATHLPSEAHGWYGADRFLGGSGSDTFYGGDGDDRIDGRGGNDIIHGGWGNDGLAGGDGNDQLWGDAMADTMFGDGGNDTLYGGGGKDHLDGGAGHDRVMGGENNDWLFGSAGDDVLIGGDGDDTLMGNDGDDTLDGEAGSDQLIVGQGDAAVQGEGDEFFIEGCTGGNHLTHAVVTTSAGLQQAYLNMTRGWWFTGMW